jgi:hypothetical protein
MNGIQYHVCPSRRLLYRAGGREKTMHAPISIPMIGQLMPLKLRIEFLKRVLSPRPTARRRQLKHLARALVSGR